MRTTGPRYPTDLVFDAFKKYYPENVLISCPDCGEHWIASKNIQFQCLYCNANIIVDRELAEEKEKEK